MIDKRFRPMPSLPRLLGAAAVVAGLLAGCVSTERSGESGTVAIAIFRNVERCADEYEIACVELDISNQSGSPVEFALSTIDDLVVSYEGDTGGCAPGSKLEATDIGTFQAPSRFLTVRPGRSSRLIVPVPDVARGNVDVFCVVIEDTEGTEYRVPIQSAHK